VRGEFLIEHQTFSEDTINIPYSKDLACGACIRAGYSYCALKEGNWYRRAANDVCCNTDKCIEDNSVRKGKDQMDCVTMSPFFN
jgi:hypothetical protein